MSSPLKETNKVKKTKMPIHIPRSNPVDITKQTTCIYFFPLSLSFFSSPFFSCTLTLTSKTSLPTPTAIILSTGSIFSSVNNVSFTKTLLSLPSAAHLTVTSRTNSLMSLLRYLPMNSAAFGEVAIR